MGNFFFEKRIKWDIFHHYRYAIGFYRPFFLVGLLNCIQCWRLCCSVNTCASMCWSPSEHVTHVFVFTSQAVTSMFVLLCLFYKIGSRWPNNCCITVWGFKDFFKMAPSILCNYNVAFCLKLSLEYTCSINTTTARKKSFFISPWRSDFHMIHNLSKAVYSFARRMSTAFSADEIVLQGYVS